MSLPFLLDYLPVHGESLLKIAGVEEKSPMRKNLEVAGAGLGGMAVGTLAGAGGAHLADKLYGHITKTPGIPKKYLSVAAPLLGGASGLAYALHQARQSEEMRRVLEDSRKRG